MGLTDWIDPFLGVDGAGNCLPGPYLPFSLVRVGPDVEPPHPTNGYRSTGKIARFTHNHVSGTGGMGRYGNVGLMPFDPEQQAGPQAREGERAWAGGYAVRLVPSGIQVELSCTPHVGLHRWTFPKGRGAVSLDAGTLIDTGYLGAELDPNGFPIEALGGQVRVVGTAQLEGWARLRGGWGHGSPYEVFFHAEFDVPFARTQRLSDLSWNLFFDQPSVVARVGLSYASVERARQSLVEEATGHSFDEVQRLARQTWERALGFIEVEGGEDHDRTLLATSLYRLLCMPSDLGTQREFTGWPTRQRHFSDFYCLWDSCRNANSLLAWFMPELHAEMVGCLVDVARHKGWSADAWIAGDSAFLQGGSSLDVLLGEAAAKAHPGIDLADAWDAVKDQPTRPSPDPYRFGRYPQDAQYRWVPSDVPQCVSRHLEYRFQDHCLARLARAVGDENAAKALGARAQDLWQLWREDVCAFAPRHPDGRWVEPFDPEVVRADCWNDPWCYEGSSRQWSWNALHDTPGLIRRMGGEAAFIQRLDRFFGDEPREGCDSPGHTRMARYHPKETMLHVPYLYTEAGRPDLASARVRDILARFYNTRRDGLPDNEDMGCQSGFVISASIGLYPRMGSDRWWLTTPVFERVRVQPPGGPELEIRREGQGVGFARAEVDGEPLGGAELAHARLGGRLVIQASD